MVTILDSIYWGDDDAVRIAPSDFEIYQGERRQLLSMPLGWFFKYDILRQYPHIWEHEQYRYAWNINWNNMLVTTCCLHTYSQVPILDVASTNEWRIEMEHLVITFMQANVCESPRVG
jgi:hypothetical protein